MLRGGTYRIDYPLGQGGFGITYRAMHVALKQVVAIKEFYPQDDAMREPGGWALRPRENKQATYQRSLSRFLNEGQILAEIIHRNVVRVQDLFEEQGTAYLVMELVPGLTLRDVLKAEPEGRLPVKRVQLVLEQLVEALDQTHAADVLHLDLKPDNILMTPKERVVLIDFGAARQGLRTEGTRAFTLAYAPLEVLSGDAVGKESDIFSLGMILHELLTGKLPPSAFNRIPKDTWEPSGLEEPWNSMLRAALQLHRTNRPVAVRALLDFKARTNPQPPAIATVPTWPQHPTVSHARQPDHLSPSVTLVVAKDRQSRYRTISDAIKAAQPNTRIMVGPGRYNEELVLNKPVVIVGDGPLADIIVESTESNCIQMRTDRAIVRGLTLRGCAGRKDNKFFTVDIPYGQLLIDDCDLTSDTLACLAIYGTNATATIQGCIIHDSQSSGICIWQGGTATIVDCEIFGNALPGVEVRRSGHSVIRHCKIHSGMRSGILVYQNSDALVENCDISNNILAGVEIKQGGSATVRKSKIERNRLQAIWVYEQGKGSIENCDLTGNAGGAWSIDASSLVLRSGNKE